MMGQPAVVNMVSVCCGAETAVRAYMTALPGLAVMAPIPARVCPSCKREWLELACWSLTHVRSSMSVGRFDDPETAQAAALDATWADWTASGDKVAAAYDHAAYLAWRAKWRPFYYLGVHNPAVVAKARAR